MCACVCLAADPEGTIPGEAFFSDVITHHMHRHRHCSHGCVWGGHGTLRQQVDTQPLPLLCIESPLSLTQETHVSTSIGKQLQLGFSARRWDKIPDLTYCLSLTWKRPNPFTPVVNIQGLHVIHLHLLSVCFPSANLFIWYVLSVPLNKWCELWVYQLIYQTKDVQIPPWMYELLPEMSMRLNMK